MNEGVEVKFHAFLASDPYGDERSFSHLDYFASEKRILVPTGLESGSECCGEGKNPALMGIECWPAGWSLY
jgi:hypothetical protein